MPDHTWRHRHVNVENKKRAQKGEKPFPKYKGSGWDQESQDTGSWKPSDVDYEQVEKDLNKEGQLTWPKPKIHPDDVAPEDKYKIQGMPPELGTWDPNKARRDKKINERAQSQQQGSDIAKKKQTPEQRVNLPPFMEASGPDYAKDAAENQDFDQDVADAMQESEWRKRVDALIQAGIKAGKIVTPQGQLEMVSQAALLGGAALLYFTQTASQLMLIR